MNVKQVQHVTAMLQEKCDLVTDVVGRSFISYYIMLYSIIS
jgi:hypothetical protein